MKARGSKGGEHEEASLGGAQGAATGGAHGAGLGGAQSAATGGDFRRTMQAPVQDQTGGTQASGGVLRSAGSGVGVFEQSKRKVRAMGGAQALGNAPLGGARGLGNAPSGFGRLGLPLGAGFGVASTVGVRPFGTISARFGTSEGVSINPFGASRGAPDTGRQRSEFSKETGGARPGLGGVIGSSGDARGAVGGAPGSSVGAPSSSVGAPGVVQSPLHESTKRPITDLHGTSSPGMLQYSLNSFVAIIIFLSYELNLFLRVLSRQEGGFSGF